MAAETPIAELEILLRQASALHRHLCPRQVLGVRLGMYAAQIFPGAFPQKSKRMLAMVEMDGCFSDGVSVSTGCTMGHRTMRLADDGKIAATFVDTGQGRAVRFFAFPDLRVRAAVAAAGAANRWQAYLQAYRQMPAEEMFGKQEVRLTFELGDLIGRHGTRTVCRVCREEIFNQREVACGGEILCRSCAGESYWKSR